MSYIYRCGGPALKEPSDQLPQLTASRAKAVAWLKSQKAQDQIAEEYVAFKEKWSPIFPD